MKFMRLKLKGLNGKRRTPKHKIPKKLKCQKPTLSKRQTLIQISKTLNLPPGRPISWSKWFSVNFSLSSSACTKVYKSSIWSWPTGASSVSRNATLASRQVVNSEISAGNSICVRKQTGVKVHHILPLNIRRVERNVKSRFIKFVHRHPVWSDTIAVSSKAMCPWQWRSDQNKWKRSWGSSREVKPWHVLAAVSPGLAEVFPAELKPNTLKRQQKEVAMAIRGYLKLFQTIVGSAVEKHVQYMWKVRVHVQYEVPRHVQRDTWSQVTSNVAEVLPLRCTLSSHRTDLKFQIPLWLKQHQKQQVTEWTEIEVECFLFLEVPTKPSSHWLACSCQYES